MKTGKKISSSKQIEEHGLSITHTHTHIHHITKINESSWLYVLLHPGVSSATEGSVECCSFGRSMMWCTPAHTHHTHTHTCDQDKEAFKGIYQYPPAVQEKGGKKREKRAQRSNKREQRTSWSDFQTQTLNTWSSPAIGFGDYPAPMSPLYIIKSQISSSLVSFWQKFLHDHRQCAELPIYLLLTL